MRPVSWQSREILAGICALVVVLAALPGLAFAQGKQQGKAKETSEVKGKQQGEFTLDFMIGFNTKDARRWATDFDLVGQKPLPPGIRKNLARGKPLPPGITKQSLPAPFVKQLPGHAGYEWRMAGTDLLLISTADMIVREIVKDVFD